MALAACVQEGLWIRSAFNSLNQQVTLPFIVYADNTGAISLSSNPLNHSRTKHVDVRYHFLREHISKGVFTPKWIPTHQNVADLLTKSLARSSFQVHRTGLSLVPR